MSPRISRASWFSMMLSGVWAASGGGVSFSWVPAEPSNRHLPHLTHQTRLLEASGKATMKPWTSAIMVQEV